MNNNRAFGLLQRIGRSFMLPIALLPVAGFLLGIGSSFTNAAMIGTYHLQGILGKGTFLFDVLTIMSATGQIIFSNLSIIFALGVALGMAEKEKGTATLSAAIAYLVMNQTISSLLTLTGRTASSLPTGSITTLCGITTLQTGVFGGIIVGLGVAALHNRFYKIKLPTALSFFGGTRFIPIISTITYIFIGALMFFVWPFIQEGISALGGLVRNSGYIGTFFYGLIERALIPFGLHPVFYLPFWQTGVGGTMVIDGKMISGAQNIFFAQLASPTTAHFSVDATRFFTGKFPFMIFGLPGAALAMYTTAKDSKKKVVGGLLLSAALTAMLTGITEPIEFTFLFVAPFLYVIHCLLAGLSFMLMHILNCTVGMTFSGGIIDLTLFGILQGNAKTHWIWVPIIGAAYFVIYFFMFRFIILKFNLKTPGREDDESETKLYTRKDLEARDKAKTGGKKEGAKSSDAVSALILEGLGGADNLRNVDCCATRLRVTVIDAAKVNDAVLKNSGAVGVIKSGTGIQAIYGPQVAVIKSNLEDYLSSMGKSI